MSDFSCQKCGKECDCSPAPPDRAICPECCANEDGHDYKYEPGERDYYCIKCGQLPPFDWYSGRFE